MPWKFNERQSQHEFKSAGARSAFRAGYSDGYHEYPSGFGNEDGHHQCEYDLGYALGTEDRRDRLVKLGHA